MKMLDPTPVCEIVQHWPGKFDQLLNEDVLDLDLVELSTDDAEGEILACNDHLRVTDEMFRINKLTIDSIPISLFNTLFGKATSLRNPGASYLTGLKIHFGLKGTSVSLLFQPICMHKNLDGSHSIVDGPIYNFETNQFKIKTGFGELNDYKSNIRIKHFGETSFTRHVFGDTESVIFPFQTLLALMHANPTEPNIFFHNAIRKSNIHTDNMETVKHTLLLSSKPKPFLQPISPNKFANRSHLCPPSCRQINSYVIHTDGPTICVD